MEAKFRLLEKRIRKIGFNRDEIFRKNSRAHPFDHKRNEEILEDLKVEPVNQKLRRYNSNLLRHITKIYNNRMPKLMLNCRPTGRRRF
jgi:hypothetical protein